MTSDACPSPATPHSGDGLSASCALITREPDNARANPGASFAGTAVDNSLISPRNVASATGLEETIHHAISARNRRGNGACLVESTRALTQALLNEISPCIQGIPLFLSPVVSLIYPSDARSASADMV